MKPYAAPLLIAIVALTGCTTTGPGFVAREWTRNMRELGIYPVFPPREDVQVGDVYLMPAFEESCRDKAVESGPLPLSLLLTTLSGAVNSADTFYAARISFPKEPAGSASGAQASGSPNAAFASQDRRLRVVGFPSFLSVTVSSANLGAYLTASGLPASAGLAMDKSSTASVSVSVAESYAVPLATLLPQLFAPTDGSPPQSIKPELFGQLPISHFSVDHRSPVCAVKRDQVELLVINEVFYTRNIDVAVSNSSNAGFLLDYVKPGSKGSGDPNAGADSGSTSDSASDGSQPASGSGQIASGQVAAPDQGSKPDSTANGVKAEMANKSAQESAKAADAARAGIAVRAQTLSKRHKVPGATLDISQSSRGDVALSTRFDRPVAIGYKGVSYCVNTDLKICGVASTTIPATGEGPGPKK